MKLAAGVVKFFGRFGLLPVPFLGEFGLLLNGEGCPSGNWCSGLHLQSLADPVSPFYGPSILLWYARLGACEIDYGFYLDDNGGG